MAAWWALAALGSQGLRAQSPPSPGQDPWKVFGEGAGGLPPACWPWWALGSPTASEEGQGQDRGMACLGCSEPLPPITPFPSHLRKWLLGT